MIRQALGRAFRVFLPSLGSWAASNADASDGLRWEQPEPHSRILLHEFLTTQHYIRQERDPFKSSLMRTRAMMAEAPSDSCHSSRLLLDTLEANQATRDRDLLEGIRLYKDLIARETRFYRTILRRVGTIAQPGLVQERRVLAILRHNCGLVLAEAGAAPVEIEEQYRRAIEYQPDLTMLRESLAEFYLKHRSWDQAAAAFREGYATSALFEQDDAWDILNWRLARVSLMKAAALALPADLSSSPLLLPSGISSDGGAAEHITGLQQALEVIDSSLTMLDWSGIPAWKGKALFERAVILERLGRVREAVDAYVQSADTYGMAKDLASATYGRMMSGDLLARSASLPESAAVYWRALEDVSLIKSQDERTTDTVKTERRQSLLARLALLSLARGEQKLARDRLAESLKPQAQDWGPYYEVLSETKALLGRPELRHPVSILYHQLLGDSEYPESQRDLTAALLKLYEYERDDLEAKPSDPDLVRDTATVTKNLNVVTPLTIEISEAFTDRANLTDDAIAQYAAPVRSSVADRFGVRMPGVRVRTNAALTYGKYELIHEVPLARGTHVGDSLQPVFQHVEELIAANLVELVAHQEVQNYLERNLLVQPNVPDIADKENCRHMDSLSAVLRALVTERVPLQGAWQFSEADVKDVAALAEKIKGMVDEVSRFLSMNLSSATMKCLGDSAESRADGRSLRKLLVEDLNRILEIEEFYAAPRFESITLRLETKARMSQKPEIRELRVLNRLLLEDAYPLELEKGPLEYPGLIYQTFRRGWDAGHPLSDITERIRRIPQVRDRLWGNDGSYIPLLVPPALEDLIDSCVREAGSYRVLVLEPRQAAGVLDVLQAGLRAYPKPALVSRRQEQRSLVRALISARLPEVPLLSVHEVRPGALRALAMLEVPKERAAHDTARTGTN